GTWIGRGRSPPLILSGRLERAVISRLFAANAGETASPASRAASPARATTVRVRPLNRLVGVIGAQPPVGRGRVPAGNRAHTSDRECAELCGGRRFGRRASSIIAALLGWAQYVFPRIRRRLAPGRPWPGPPGALLMKPVLSMENRRGEMARASRPKAAACVPERFVSPACPSRVRPTRRRVAAGDHPRRARRLPHV